MTFSRNAGTAVRTGSRKTTIGFVAGLFTAAVAATTAFASPAGASPAPAGQASAVTVRPGPHGSLTVHVSGRSAAAPALATPAPSTSPSVTHQFVPDGGGFTCESGYACAGVPYSTGVYVFKFYYYGSYSLSYWFNTGFVINNQTGGAAFRIYNSSGGQVRCFPASPNPQNGVDWDPIWSVRLTSSGC